MELLDRTPLWMIGLVCLAALILAHAFGHLAGRRIPRDGHSEAREYLVASALSLSSLMMAFTFDAAQTDFRLRQTAVADEANAIGTAYLRTQMFDPAFRARIGQDVLSYAKVRGEFYGATGHPAALDRNEAETRRLQTLIWTVVGDAVGGAPASSLNAPIVESVNEMFDSADARAAAQDIRIPSAVLLVLMLAGLLSAALVGFAGSGKRRYPVILAAVLFIQVMAFCLILALDRPDATTVKISQRPMDQVIADIGGRESSSESLR